MNCQRQQAPSHPPAVQPYQLANTISYKIHETCLAHTTRNTVRLGDRAIATINIGVDVYFHNATQMLIAEVEKTKLKIDTAGLPLGESGKFSKIIKKLANKFFQVNDLISP